MELASVAVKVVERREDGRGGIVEVPIAPETPLVDFSRTAGGGGKAGKLTLEDLRQMASNFALFPGPVKIGAGPHVDDGSGPGLGFMQAVRLRGSVLWATLDLGPQLFTEVVDLRAWRGFSIEAAKNLKKPTVEFDGWVLTGGVFTNTPALDVEFHIPDSIAASVGEAVEHRIATLVLGEAEATTKRNDIMDEKTISLATHETKLEEVKAAATSEVAQMKAQLETATTQVTSLTETVEKHRKRVAELDQSLATVTIERDALAATQKQTATSKDATIAALRAEATKNVTRMGELELEAREANARALDVDVRTVITEAIAAGVPPAEFDGFEAGPAVWLNARFVSLDALKQHCMARTASVKLSGPIAPTKSGSDPNADAKDDEPKLTDEERKVLERLNLADGPNYDGVVDAADAKARKLAWEAKQKA